MYSRIVKNQRAAQRGVSLIIVLLLLVIVSMLGVASMQIATMSERAARNDRDMQLAWQSAENALVDAEIDLTGPNAAGTSRTAAIQAGPQVPESGCTTTGTWRGFCAAKTSGSTKPSWLQVSFTDTSSTAPTVALGAFTGRAFSNAGSADGTGIQPALAPRYIFEDVSAFDTTNAGGNQVGSQYASGATAGSKAAAGRVYRVTAMGFGPRSSTQAVLQTVYRN